MTYGRPQLLSPKVIFVLCDLASNNVLYNFPALSLLGRSLSCSSHGLLRLIYGPYNSSLSSALYLYALYGRDPPGYDYLVTQWQFVAKTRYIQYTTGQDSSLTI